MTTNCSQGAGFYKRNTAGNALIFSSVAVHFPGGSSIEVAKHAEYEYPVNGWTYYESKDAAYAAEGLEAPPLNSGKNRLSLAEKITARRAMTTEERDAERIARLEKRHPEKAEQLKARLAQKQSILEQRKSSTSEELKESKVASTEGGKKVAKSRKARKSTKSSTPAD